MSPTTVEPDERFDWCEVAEIDVTMPYWIHRAGHADWSGARTMRHTHAGFAEMFWVESGKAMHEVNGVEHPVRPGDLVFVDTGDVHRFRAASADLCFVKLAVPNEIVDEVVARYVEPDASPWHRAVPRVARLAVHDWARLRELGSALGHCEPRRRRVDHFLLELLIILDGPVPAREPMPDWLAEAIRAWSDDPVARCDGVSGIARLAFRSREHVSRAIKQATGSRAVDLVNTAAHRTRRGDAADVGPVDRARRRRVRPAQPEPLLRGVQATLRRDAAAVPPQPPPRDQPPRAGRPDAYLTLPSRTPCTNQRWKMRNSTSGGANATSPAAFIPA